jgi:predicted outer membrane repeat protein
VEGGGIHLNSYNNVQIYNSTLYNNSTTGGEGGGIYAPQMASILLVDSLVNQNRSKHAGGGILVHGSVTFNRCVISNNHADEGGGAVWGGASATNSAFIGNSAYEGGAIYGSASLVNVTMHSNQAVNTGGAISEPYSLNIHNSTIVYNHAGSQGGGFFFRGNDYLSHIGNNILFGNTSNSGPDCVGNPISDGFNLIGNMSGCSIPLVSSDRTNINPQLMPLYPSATFLTPIPGSPALDGGNPAGCTDGTNLLTFDLISLGYEGRLVYI